jgi:DNA-binding transcriptional ArsR family regulator
LSGDIDDIREEIREELRALKEEIREEVLRALRRSGYRGISVRIGEDELEEAEPSTVVFKDIVRMIRDSVKKSLVERGEQAVDDLVESMPETSAAELLKSLANTERIRIVKILYTGVKTFSELKGATGLEAPSVSHHLKTLVRMGLVGHSDLGGYELTRRGRFLLRTLALIHEAMGGEAVE